MTATHHALKNKHVSILGKVGSFTQINGINLVSFLDSQVVWCAVKSLWHFVIGKWLVACSTLFSDPVADSSQQGHVA